MYNYLQNNPCLMFNNYQNNWFNTPYFDQQMNYGYQPYMNSYFNNIRSNTYLNNTTESSKTKKEDKNSNYSWYSASDKIKESKEEKDPSKYFEYFLKSLGIIVGAIGTFYAGKGVYKLVKSGFSKITNFFKPKVATP